jgi:hypothetical protein
LILLLEFTKSNNGSLHIFINRHLSKQLWEVLDQKAEEALEVGLAVADLEAEEVDLEIEILEDLREEPLKCMMLPAINAIKNARFHLDQPAANLFIAVIASRVKVQVIVLIQEIREAVLVLGTEIDHLRQE